MKTSTLTLAVAALFALGACSSADSEPTATKTVTKEAKPAAKDKPAKDGAVGDVAGDSVDDFKMDDAGKFKDVDDLLDVNNKEKWDGGCFTVEDKINSYDGSKYTSADCAITGMDAQVSAQVGNYEEPCAPVNPDQACYVGENWWMGAWTEYALKQSLPKGYDPELIYTYEDIQELEGDTEGF